MLVAWIWQDSTRISTVAQEQACSTPKRRLEAFEAHWRSVFSPRLQRLWNFCQGTVGSKAN